MNRVIEENSDNALRYLDSYKSELSRKKACNAGKCRKQEHSEAKGARRSFVGLLIQILFVLALLAVQQVCA
ncbi:hypothetical protein NERG_02688, partial [Nematocida ausubeli]